MSPIERALRRENIQLRAALILNKWRIAGEARALALLLHEATKQIPRRQVEVLP
jgi:hypothetical protein